MSDTASSSAEEDGTHTYHSQFCKYLTPVRTGVGLLTTLVVWLSSIGLILSIKSFPFGIYLAFIGVPLFLLEAGYVIRLCCGVEGVCCRVFALILNFDGVRRGFLYSLFAIFCFYPNLTGSSIAPGVLLTITAVLYLLKSVQFKKVVVAQESESNVQSVGRTVA